MRTVVADFPDYADAQEAQEVCETVCVTNLFAWITGWRLEVNFPDDGIGSQHVSPERLDLVLEAIQHNGGTPVPEP